MCEPQAVSTDFTYVGAVGSETSKILMPSQDALTAADWPTLLQESSERDESVDR